MPITSGAYVNPGWHNDTDPYINQTEMNAISDTLAKVPIKNGGTGATTASAALTNLGAEPIANVKSKGSATTPVYFNSSGVATPITGPIPASIGGTGVASVSELAEALKVATMATAGGTVGSATTPVYVNKGVLTACSTTLKTYTGTSPITVSGTAISHATSGVTSASKGDTSAQTPTWGGTFKVPSGTVNATGHLTSFADHTVTIPNKAMTGATSSAAGAVGLVPAPAKGNQSSFLRGDGTWATPTNTTDLASMTGTLAIAKGGTGGTSAETAKINLRAVGVTSSYDGESVGSKTQPCYGSRSSNGVLYLTPCTYTLGKSVPSNAVFTDTTYSATSPIALSGTTFSHANSGVTAATYGTNSSTALTPTWGATFSVPGLAVNATGHVTSASSHTVKIPNAAATTSAAGLMSSADKTKLNAIGTVVSKSGTDATIAAGASVTSSISLTAGTWIIVGWGNITTVGAIRVDVNNGSTTMVRGVCETTYNAPHTEGVIMTTLSSAATISAKLTTKNAATGKVSIEAVRVA